MIKTIEHSPRLPLLRFTSFHLRIHPFILSAEILKQIWDLSDQDQDSMLSHREFCTALYLMEKSREGRPLPPVLPTGKQAEDSGYVRKPGPWIRSDG